MENLGKNVDKALHLNQRQISHLIVFLLFAGFFIFMLGYYLGKKMVIEDNYSQGLMSNTASSIINAVEDFKSPSEQNESIENDDFFNSSSADAEKKNNESSGAEENNLKENIIKPLHSAVEKDKSITNIYYCGQLAGFGTERAAEKYLDDIKKKGFAARLVKRKSHAVNGIERTWYQVTTPYLNSKGELEETISKMKKARLCNSVEIVTVKK